VLVLASARTEVADVISSIIYVYSILIFLYIVIQLLFNAGVRPPYSRTTGAVLQFLHDTCEPYLRIFRRMLPNMGGWDFSPILGLLVLVLVNKVVVQGLIHG
jgi:YggT family protein